jgi:Flp pilus assembly protein TadB
MKFPQIFRTTQPMRFDIKPRYYDPVREEIEQRTARIKKELQADGKLPVEDGDEEGLSYYSSSIRGSFTGGSQIKGRTSSALHSAGMIRLVIFVLLIVSLFGYIYYGPEAIYILLYIVAGISLLFVFFRLKRKQRK